MNFILSSFFVSWHRRMAGESWWYSVSAVSCRVFLPSCHGCDRTGAGFAHSVTAWIGRISPLNHADVNFRVVLWLLEVAERKGFANLVLMEIEPTYPSEKYGYNHGVSSVSSIRKRRALRSRLRSVRDVLWSITCMSGVMRRGRWLKDAVGWNWTVTNLLSPRGRPCAFRVGRSIRYEQRPCWR